MLMPERPPPPGFSWCSWCTFSCFNFNFSLQGPLLPGGQLSTQPTPRSGPAEVRNRVADLTIWQNGPTLFTILFFQPRQLSKTSMQSCSTQKACAAAVEEDMGLRVARRDV